MVRLARGLAVAWVFLGCPAIADAAEPLWRVGSRLGCVEARPGVPEVPYNGRDDDCNPSTLDDDLDNDGLPLGQDCDDRVPGAGARRLSGDLTVSEDEGVCEDDEPVVVYGDLIVDSEPSELSCVCGVAGDLVVRDTDLSSIDGLDGLVGVAGDVIIDANPNLTGLEGLSALTSVRGDLVVSDNDDLASLVGLGGVRSVDGSVEVQHNAILTGLMGLSSLGSIGEDMHVSGNPSMEQADGLESLLVIGGDLEVSDNASMKAMSGLAQLEAVGGDVEVSGNLVLRGITGLTSLAAVSGSMGVTDNPELLAVGGLEALTVVDGGVVMSGNPQLRDPASLATAKASTADEGSGVWQGLADFGIGASDPGSQGTAEADEAAGIWQGLAEFGIEESDGVVLVVLVVFLIIVGIGVTVAATHAVRVLLRSWARDDEDDEVRAKRPVTPTWPRDPRLPEGLQHIDPEARSQAWIYLQSATVPFGTRLIEVDDDDPTLVWIVEGELEIVVDDIPVATVGPDEIVGEMALFRDGKRGAAVEAVTPVRMVVLDRQGYVALRGLGNPVARVVEEAAMEGIGRRLRATTNEVLDQLSGISIDEVAQSPGFADLIGQWLDEAVLAFEGRSGELLELLSEVDLFSGAEPAALGALAGRMERRAVPSGTVLCAEGEVGHEMYVVLQGEVTVAMVATTTTLRRVARLGPGDACGMVSLFTGQPRTASCVATGPVTVAVLPVDRFRQLVRSDELAGSVLRVAMIRAMSDALTFANKQLAGG